MSIQCKMAGQTKITQQSDVIHGPGVADYTNI